MPLIGQTEPNNIVALLDKDIDDFFGLADLSHQSKTACVRLCDEQPRKDGAELVRRLLNRIAQNRSALTQTDRAARGSQTWRWKKNTSLSRENKSIEVRIERAVARLLDDDWVNQVPTASGLTDGDEQRRSIDIIHRHSAVELDFIELKALRPGERSSGHQSPLSAAMELLKYALIFLYCKETRTVLYPDTTVARPVLEAEKIHLEVLATPNCYRRSERTEPFRIAWLDQLLVSGLMELSRRPNVAVSFDFAFRAFPESFVWTDSDHVQLLTCEPTSDCWIALRKKLESAFMNRVPVALIA
jgi:hypothetical protein